MQVQLVIESLVGCLPAYREAQDLGQNTVRPSALWVEAVLADRYDTLGIPARTAHAEAGFTGCAWNTVLTFVSRYSELDHTTQLALTVWETREGAPRRPLAGTTMRLFSKKGRLKTGPQSLRLWTGAVADAEWPSRTPGKVPLAQRGERGRVERVLKRYERGELEAMPWLDVLTQTAIGALEAEARQGRGPLAAPSPSEPGLAGAEKNGLTLHLELASFPSAVVYRTATLPAAPGVGGPLVGLQAGDEEDGVAAATHDAMRSPLVAGLRGLPDRGTGGEPRGERAGAEAERGVWVKQPEFAAAGAVETAAAPRSGTPEPGPGRGRAPGPGPSAGPGTSPARPRAWRPVVDPELGRDNPSELKARKLARSHTRGLVDPGAKPGAEERRVLDGVLSAPGRRALSGPEAVLLWRYRYALSGDVRALAPFLRSVDWGDAGEAAQAAALMAAWAPIGVAQALELLGPDFQAGAVRAHAVAALERTPDGELLACAMQLVQALRFEARDDSRLAAFLARRGSATLRLAAPLFWYLCVELDDVEFGMRAGHVQAALLARAGPDLQEALAAQLDLAARLRSLSDHVQGTRGSATRKTEALRAQLSPGGPRLELTALRCPNPLDSDVLLLGLEPGECSVFKSAMSPLRLVFRVEPVGDAESRVAGGVPGPAPSADAHDGRGGAAPGEGAESGRGPEQGAVDRDAAASDGESRHAVPSPSSSSHVHAHASAAAAATANRPRRTTSLIYKRGDDLRQDQLVVQMIALMDDLLRRDGLDLRVQRYAVLATSSSDGLIEFVPSTPLARLLASHRTIPRWLAAQGGGDPAGPLGLQQTVLANFVKSCAAACVMTYVLGVGDRHLDNLLLTPDGCLFHIDFGYILGRDPKPFPPPMKLCREMVDALGGAGSEHYARFASHACEAFNCLRKSASLLTGLLSLMAGSRLPDLAADPEAALLKVQEKLRLDLGDEDAAQFMRGLLAESASALMPQILETTHRWAQYWR